MTLYFFENQFDHFTTRHHDRVPYQNWERAVIRLNSFLGFQAKNIQALKGLINLDCRWCQELQTKTVVKNKE